MELLKTPNDFFDKFRDIAENCNQIGQWQKFRLAAYEYLHPRKTAPRLNLRPNYDPDDEATRKSWEGPFVGNAASVLKETIMKHTQCPSPNLYSLSMSVVQSSGTGKSRLIDELARTIPVVFLNTRPENHSGL
ncbi:hypothetical protein H0H93_003901 [Arthromyces matolae]|nr:hypothetical protein H0H93_003901 [Arthromyces matolae]